MLEYNNHIPVTAGSALVPGGTGNPPRLLYTGYYATANASFPDETWENLPPALKSGFHYNTAYSNAVYHGFEQRFDWRGLVYNTAHHSAFDIYGSGYGQSGSSYRRYNYGQPVAAKDNVAYRFFDKSLQCSSTGIVACFDITAIKYSAAATTYMEETVYLPSRFTDTAVPYNVALRIGDVYAIQSAGTVDLNTLGGVFISDSYALQSNAHTNYNPFYYWSGSSTVTRESWDRQTRITYDYRLIPNMSFSSYNCWTTNPTSITGVYNHLTIGATAYGDIYIY